MVCEEALVACLPAWPLSPCRTRNPHSCSPEDTDSAPPPGQPGGAARWLTWSSSHFSPYASSPRDSHTGLCSQILQARALPTLPCPSLHPVPALPPGSKTSSWSRGREARLCRPSCLQPACNTTQVLSLPGPRPPGSRECAVACVKAGARGCPFPPELAPAFTWVPTWDKQRSPSQW